MTLPDAVDVVALINALPAPEDVTMADREALKAARAAYEAMSDEQKAEVGPTVHAKLTAAEMALGYAVTVVDGTDTPLWEIITPADATTKGVRKDTKVELKYTGDRRVKEVTATSDGASGPVLVESIELNERNKITITRNYNSRELKVFRVLPITATDKSVTWSTDGTYITKSSEDNDSFTIRGKSYGTGWVKATANDGSGVSVTLEVEYKQ